MDPLKNNENKASSLPGNAGLSGARAGGNGSGRGRRSGVDALTAATRPKERRGGAWAMDVIILLLIIGVVVGLILGYRYLKNTYAPAWETREITYCILVEGLNPSMVPRDKNGTITLVDKDVWSSDREDADRIGRVRTAEAVTVMRNGVETVDLYLHVDAQAQYRAGGGYRMDSTRLLAGAQGVYRFAGLIAPGQIISLEETDAS